MSGRGRWIGALGAGLAGALALALAGGAIPARAGTAPGLAGPRIALATAWGPTFWQALRNGAPITFTPAGDAIVVAPGLGSDQQVIEELAPGGSVLWQTSAYQEIHSVVSFDGGARLAFLALPMPSARPYHLVLGILDPATDALAQTAIDYRAGGGLVAAGRNVLVTGGFATSAFAAIYGPSGDLVSALALPGYPTVFATAAGAEVLATQGAETTLWAVNGITGAVAPSGTIPTAEGVGMHFSALPGGGLLEFTGQPDLPGSTLTAWRPGAGGFSQAWTWPASRSVNTTYGYGAVAPSGTLAALPVGSGVDVVRTLTGTVAASVAAQGYAMRVVGAQPDGFVVLEVPVNPTPGDARPDRLATFGWQGLPVGSATLPATQNPLNEPVYEESANVDGVALTVTSIADDVAAIGPATAGGSLPASLPAALETAPLTLGSSPPPAASLEVVAAGQAVDAAHPLVVDAAQTGRLIPIEVLVLDAAGTNVPAPSADPFTVTDGGAGGTFLPAPQWGIPPGALGASMTYENAKPGSYTLGATLTNRAALPPLFTLPRTATAGAPLQVTFDPARGSVRSGETVEIAPVAGSDLASDAPVDATAQAGGTYVASFVAGTRTGAAAFEAILPKRRIDLGESPMLDVGAIVAPSVAMQYTSAGLKLTLWPAADGDSPVGFVVTPSNGAAPIVAAYLGAPVVVVVPGHAPVSVTVAAIDANGAETAPLGGGVG